MGSNPFKVGDFFRLKPENASRFFIHKLGVTYEVVRIGQNLAGQPTVFSKEHGSICVEDVIRVESEQDRYYHPRLPHPVVPTETEQRVFHKVADHWIAESELKLVKGDEWKFAQALEKEGYAWILICDILKVLRNV